MLVNSIRHWQRWKRWLCELIDDGRDVTTQIQTILRQTNSVAVLGVLINVGKHAPKTTQGTAAACIGPTRHV